MSCRILVGTAETAKYVYNITNGFRELGHKADSLVLDPVRHKFYNDLEYTLTDLDFLRETTLYRKSDGRVGIRTTRAFRAFVERYDVFVFFSGTSLLPRMVDLPVLKQMGKKVISRQCGSEVRDAALAREFWRAHGQAFPRAVGDAPAAVRCADEYDVVGLSRYHPAFANKLHTTRMAEQYADAIISGSPSQMLGLRPYFQSGPIFDMREFTFKVPRRAVPIILHAPSNIEFKKTHVFLKVLQELQDEGVRFHLELLHGVPHGVVQQKLAEADVLLDQLSCGCGTLAYEGMASGCVVLGGHQDAASPLPRNRPIVHVTEATLKERLRRVILDVRYRTLVAAQSREYINAGYGSPVSVARYMLDALDRDAVGDADLFPTLFVERGVAPEGQSVPEYLKEGSLAVLKKFGAFPRADLARLISVGLLPEGAVSELGSVPRWDESQLVREGPWVTTGPNATYGMPGRLRC